MKKILDLNSDVLEGRALGRGRDVVESKDGWKVQGWLMKPVNFEAGRKYPLVLYIHGGPWSMYNVASVGPWQNFAANGYAVLYTESARLDGLRPGVRQRHPVQLSREGLRRPDGGRGRGARRRASWTSATCSCAAAAAAAC